MKNREDIVRQKEEATLLLVAEVARMREYLRKIAERTDTRTMNLTLAELDYACVSAHALAKEALES